MNNIYKVISWWSIRKFGYLILFTSIFLGILGYLGVHVFGFTGWKQNLLQDFYANFSTELFSLAITILIVDKLYEDRAVTEEKKRLVLQMGSPDNSFAIEAVWQLRVKGWLFDGSLVGADLTGAKLDNADLSYSDLRNTRLLHASLNEADIQNVNFENAILSGASLCSAKLSRVNFKNARLNHVDFEGAIMIDIEFDKAQIRFANFTNSTGPHNHDERFSLTPFQVADSLRGTILQDGKKYSGEYNLQGDVRDAKIIYDVDIDNNDAMNRYYYEARESVEIMVDKGYKSWIEGYKARTK